mmetsp:Transcript_17233/g.37615  ORF Transcript_17233/g.37615 Transcript_17233/m.37615 type:complete len:84 (-) Transcript_17233:112-363(-)
MTTPRTNGSKAWLGYMSEWQPMKGASAARTGVHVGAAPVHGMVHGMVHVGTRHHHHRLLDDADADGACEYRDEDMLPLISSWH